MSSASCATKQPINAAVKPFHLPLIRQLKLTANDSPIMQQVIVPVTCRWLGEESLSLAVGLVRNPCHLPLAKEGISVTCRWLQPTEMYDFSYSLSRLPLGWKPGEGFLYGSQLIRQLKLKANDSPIMQQMTFQLIACLL